MKNKEIDQERLLRTYENAVASLAAPKPAPSPLLIQTYADMTAGIASGKNNMANRAAESSEEEDPLLKKLREMRDEAEAQLRAAGSQKSFMQVAQERMANAKFHPSILGGTPSEWRKNYDQVLARQPAMEQFFAQARDEFAKQLPEGDPLLRYLQDESISDAQKNKLVGTVMLPSPFSRKEGERIRDIYEKGVGEKFNPLMLPEERQLQSQLRETMGKAKTAPSNQTEMDLAWEWLTTSNDPDAVSIRNDGLRNVMGRQDMLRGLYDENFQGYQGRVVEGWKKARRQAGAEERERNAYTEAQKAKGYSTWRNSQAGRLTENQYASDLWTQDLRQTARDPQYAGDQRIQQALAAYEQNQTDDNRAALQAAMVDFLMEQTYAERGEQYKSDDIAQARRAEVSGTAKKARAGHWGGTATYKMDQVYDLYRTNPGEAMKMWNQLWQESDEAIRETTDQSVYGYGLTGGMIDDAQTASNWQDLIAYLRNDQKVLYYGSAIFNDDFIARKQPIKAYAEADPLYAAIAGMKITETTERGADGKQRTKINREYDENAQAKLLLGDMMDREIGTAGARVIDVLDGLSKVQRDTYLYWYAEDGKEAAEDYLATISPGVLAQVADERREKEYNWALENPFPSMVQDFLMNPVRDIMSLKYNLRNLFSPGGLGLSPHIRDMDVQDSVTTHRSATEVVARQWGGDLGANWVNNFNKIVFNQPASEQTIKDARKAWGDWFSFLKTAGDSTADSLYHMGTGLAVSGIIKAIAAKAGIVLTAAQEGMIANTAMQISILPQAGQAGASTLANAKERGYSSGTAMIKAGMATFWEWLSETWGMERLVKKGAPLWDNIAQMNKFAAGMTAVAMSGAAEGAEEIFGGVGYYVTEGLMNWSESDVAADLAAARSELTAKARMTGGPDPTEEEVWWKAITNKATELGLEALSASLSAGVTAAGGTMFGRMGGYVGARMDIGSRVRQGIVTETEAPTMIRIQQMGQEALERVTKAQQNNLTPMQTDLEAIQEAFQQEQELQLREQEQASDRAAEEEAARLGFRQTARNAEAEQLAEAQAQQEQKTKEQKTQEPQAVEEQKPERQIPERPDENKPSPRDAERAQEQEAKTQEPQAVEEQKPERQIPERPSEEKQTPRNEEDQQRKEEEQRIEEALKRARANAETKRTGVAPKGVRVNLNRISDMSQEQLDAEVQRLETELENVRRAPATPTQERQSPRAAEQAQAEEAQAQQDAERQRLEQEYNRADANWWKAWTRIGELNEAKENANPTEQQEIEAELEEKKQEVKNLEAERGRLRARLNELKQSPRAAERAQAEEAQAQQKQTMPEGRVEGMPIDRQVEADIAKMNAEQQTQAEQETQPAAEETKEEAEQPAEETKQEEAKPAEEQKPAEQKKGDRAEPRAPVPNVIRAGENGPEAVPQGQEQGQLSLTVDELKNYYRIVRNLRTPGLTAQQRQELSDRGDVVMDARVNRNPYEAPAKLDGEKVTVTGIESTGPDATVKVRTGDTTTVEPLKNVRMRDYMARIYERAAAYTDLDTARLFLYGWQRSNTIMPTTYIRAFEAIYTAGRLGNPLNALEQKVAESLPTEVVDSIMRAGERVLQQTETEMGVSTEETRGALRNAVNSIRNRTERQTGLVFDEDVDPETIRAAKLTEIVALDELANALKTRLRIVRHIDIDTANLDLTQTDAQTLEKFSVLNVANHANAYFNPANGEIVVALDAMEGGLTTVATHEVWHYINELGRQAGEKGDAAFAQEVTSFGAQLLKLARRSDRNFNLSRRVDQIIRQYESVNALGFRAENTPEEKKAAAIEEIQANALFAISNRLMDLSGEDTQIQSLAQEHPTVMKKLRDAFKRWTRAMTKTIRKVSAAYRETSAILQASEEDIEKLAQGFNRLVEMAGQRTYERKQGDTERRYSLETRKAVEDANRAAEKAGMVAPQQFVYSLAGVQAQGKYGDIARKARLMSRTGMSDAEIIQKTGAVKGFRGNWWAVIDRNGFKLNPRWVMDQTDTDLRQAGDYLDHVIDAPELFEAYPQLKNARVNVRDDMGEENLGSMYADDRTDEIVIELNGKMLDHRAGEEEVLDVLLHEIQHAIQSKEGTHRGANIATWQKIRNAYMARIRAVNQHMEEMRDKYGDEFLSAIPLTENYALDTRQMSQAKVDQFNDQMDPIDFVQIRDDLMFQEKWNAIQDRSAFDLYRGTVGEIEARAQEQEGKWQRPDYRGAVALEDYYDRGRGQVMYSLQGYTEAEKGRWANNDRIVIAESRGDVLQFIDEALENPNNQRKIYLGKINAGLAQKIQQIAGVNIEGYNVALYSSEVYKIIRDHGNKETEALRGQPEVTRERLADIADVIQNHDRVEVPEGKNKYYHGSLVLHFIKRSNGVTTLVAFIVNKKHDLHVQTMWINQEKENAGDPTTTGVQAPVLTPEALRGKARTVSIAQNQQGNNGQSGQSGVRHSLAATDQDYMAAVERGDMETAGRMVEEAAKRAGYTLFGYHGTKQATLRYDAMGYGEETDYKNKRLPFTIFKAGQSGGIYVATNRSVSEGFAKNFRSDNPGTVMSLYVRFENPMVVNEHVWTSVPFYYNIPTPSIMREAGYTQADLSTEEISQFAQEHGYDGVIIEGIREGGDTQTDDIIAFRSDQIKLADPVVYDDAGKVIPLSQRFNPGQQDIRYSLQGDTMGQSLFDEMQAARQKLNELRTQYNQIRDGQEYSDWMGRMSRMARDGGMDDATIAEYAEWEKKSGLARARKALDKAQKRMDEATKAFDAHIEQRNVDKEREDIEKSGLTEEEWRRKQAISMFGTTGNFAEAGYMLPDGRMLNFSGEKGRHMGHRGQDHRAIESIFASSEMSRSAAMNRFMQQGNIRMMAETPGIDISTAMEPTQAQYDAIRRMVRQYAREEYFSVDLTDENGQVVGTLEYDGRINPAKVVSDIKDFYRTGNVPETAGERYSLQTMDQDYMAAVESGDMDTARRMVEDAAKRAGFGNAIPEQATAYKVRTGRPPRKTIKVYKVFTLADDGSPTALFVSGMDKLPQNVWLDAQDTWHFTGLNGREYVPSTQNPYTQGGKTGGMQTIPNEEVRQELIRRGFLPEGSKAKSVTALAYRPGWHAGDLPFFPQGGTKIEGSTYENAHRYNQVVFECEMAADVDYTESHVTPDGKTKFHDMQRMPTNGSYKFATNPMANATDIGSWYISGALRIVRALTEEECAKILAEHGRPAQEWQQYQDESELAGLRGAERKQYENTFGPLDLTRLGYTGQQFDAARKTLAPVTYDDDGQVIPLSQRFNREVEDIRYSLEGVPQDDQAMSQLMAENQEFRDLTARLVAELNNQEQRATAQLTSKTNMRRLARELREKWQVDIPVGVLVGNLEKIFTGLATARTPAEAQAAIRTLGDFARDAILNARTTDRTDFDQYSEVRARIRSVRVTAATVKEAYGDWESFKKNGFGRVKVVRSGENVDAVYQEIQDNWPGLIKAGLTGQADQLNAMLDFLDATEVQVVNPYETEEAVFSGYGIDQATRDLAMDLMKRFAQGGTYEQVEGMPSGRMDRLNGLLDRVEVVIQDTNQKLTTQRLRGMTSRQYTQRIEEIRQRLQQAQEAVQDRNQTIAQLEQQLQAAKRETQNAQETVQVLRRRLQNEQAKLNDQEKQRLQQQIDDAEQRAKAAQRQADALQRRIDRRNQTEERNKVIRAILRRKSSLYKRLTAANPSKGFIPTEMRDAVVALLTAVDTEGEITGQPNGPLSAAMLTAARDQYMRFKGTDFEAYFNEDLEDTFNELIRNVDGKRVRDLSTKELEQIRDVVSGFAAAIINQNRVFTQNRRATLQAMGTDMIEQAKERMRKYGEHMRLGKAAGFFSQALANGMLKPVTVFGEYDGTVIGEIWRTGLRPAEDSYIRRVDTAANYLQGVIARFGGEKGWLQQQINQEDQEGREFDRRKTGREFHLDSGETIWLTAQEIMSLYAWQKREALVHTNHLTSPTGGITISRSGRGMKQSAYRLTPADLQQFIQTLTDEEKAFVDEMVGYLSTTVGSWGNEVTRELYGVEKFTESYYLPFGVDKSYTDTKFGDGEDRRIKFGSQTRAITKHAANPLMLRGFTELWCAHVEQMAIYSAFTLPLEDMARVINYREGAYDDMGQFISAGEAVHPLMKRAWGGNSVEFIKDFLDRLNANTMTTNGASFLNQLMGKAKGAAVTFNASVAIQQMGAGVRAMAVLDDRDVLTGMRGMFRFRKEYEELQKWAPIALEKSWGYFDTNMTRGLYDRQRNTWRSKLNDMGGQLASWGDEINWAQIWVACKDEIRRKQPSLTGDDFYRAAAERFRDVIDQTQVVDSIFQRSRWATENSGMKRWMAFMSEPTTQYNMLYRAFTGLARAIRAKDGTAREAAFQAFKVVKGYVFSALLTAVLKSIESAKRKRDTDKKDEEGKIIGVKSFGDKMLEAIPENFLDNLVGVTGIFGSMWSSATNMFSGGELETQWLSNAYQAVKEMAKGENADWQKVAYRATVAAGYLTGIGVGSLYRDTQAAYYQIREIWDPDWRIKGKVYDKSLDWDTRLANAEHFFYIGDKVEGKKEGKSVFVGLMMEEYMENGLSADFKKITEAAIRAGGTEKGLSDSFKAMLKKEQPLIEEAALALYDGRMDDYGNAYKQIIDSGIGSKVAESAISSRYKAIVKGNGEAEEPQELKEQTVEGVIEALTAEGSSNLVEDQYKKAYIMATITGDTKEAKRLGDILTAGGTSRDDMTKWTTENVFSSTKDYGLYWMIKNGKTTEAKAAMQHLYKAYPGGQQAVKDRVLKWAKGMKAGSYDYQTVRDVLLAVGFSQATIDKTLKK